MAIGSPPAEESPKLLGLKWIQPIEEGSQSSTSHRGTQHCQQQEEGWKTACNTKCKMCQSSIFVSPHTALLTKCPACDLPCSNSVVPANCGALLALPGEEHMASRSLQSFAQSQALLQHNQTQDESDIVGTSHHKSIELCTSDGRTNICVHLVSSKSFFLLPEHSAEKTMSILSQGTAQC